VTVGVHDVHADRAPPMYVSWSITSFVNTFQAAAVATSPAASR
jgi:hypothetical protein